MGDTQRLLKMLEGNKNVQLILDRAVELNMPAWYLGAGGIAHTVWNVLHGFAPEYGIKDYDLVYFDATSTSYEAEDAYIQKSKKLFRGIAIPVEVRNEARVHLWYEKHFGRPIAPYHSVEEAISTWPTTATSIGVRKINNQFDVYAPFGLNDLFNLTARANKAQISKEIYLAKVERWAKLWPKLKVIPWEEE